MRLLPRNRITRTGLIMCILIILTAVLGPWLAPKNPREQVLANRFAAPTVSHPLGTDSYGRDVASRIIVGTRTSLGIALASVALGLIVGSALGVTAGYFGGWLDNAIMRSVDALMAFPTILLGLMVVVALGANFQNLVLAIGLTLIPQFARLARGPTLSVREQEFVEAARASGMRTTRIILRHVIPNIAGPVGVMAALLMAQAIRVEAGLSFLGLGVAPPAPTWGNMIREGVPWIAQAPWLSVSAGMAILITVLAFNLVGDGVRDLLDPRHRKDV